MANFFLSTSMNLPIPVVGVDPGPDFANNINAALTLVDSHNHSTGQGVQINPSGLNINADLPFNGNNLITARSTRFTPQISTLSGAADLGCLYETGVDLYFNDGNGNQVRITQSGGVAGSPGSIANLASPASATYVSGSQTFVWQSAASTPANMDGGSVIIRNITASSNGITISAPNSLASNYTLTLPALPAQTNVMTLDTSGNIGSTTWNAVGQNMTATGANAIATTMGATGSNIISANRTRTTNASTVGVGGIAVSSSCGAASTTSTTFTNITNLSVTITTSGRPVWVGLVSDGSGNVSSLEVDSLSANSFAGGNYVIIRSATSVAIHNLQGGSTSSSIGTMRIGIPSSALKGIDFVGAGTYTYTAQFQSNMAFSSLVTCSFAKLVAYEL